MKKCHCLYIQSCTPEMLKVHCSIYTSIFKLSETDKIKMKIILHPASCGVIRSAVLIHCLLLTVHGVPLSEFFEFGSGTNDTGASETTNEKWQLDFEGPIPISGESYSKLIVSSCIIIIV